MRRALTEKRAALLAEVAELDRALELVERLPGLLAPAQGAPADTGRPETVAAEAAAGAGAETEAASGEATGEREPERASGPAPSPDANRYKRCLAALRQLGPRCSNAEIAEAYDCSVGYVNVLLGEMEGQGLIRREGKRRGRRIVVLEAADGIAAAKGTVSARAPRTAGRPRRRFVGIAGGDPEEVAALAAEHPAVEGARSLYPSRVVAPSDSPRLLVSGYDSPKLGDRICKGPWAGFALYSLTLEERKTCWSGCHHWRDCYGNGMQSARRHRHGPALEARLEAELAGLQARHPDGFAVRLHQLGDFYGIEYVQCWADWLDRFPALHAFGYTAWPAEMPIGAAVVALREVRWDRFAVRTSVAPSDGAVGPLATSIRRRTRGRQPEGLVCPNDADPKKVCCGSCGLCWSPTMRNTPIVFVVHGPTAPAKAEERRTLVAALPAARKPAAAPAASAPDPAAGGADRAVFDRGSAGAVGRGGGTPPRLDPPRRPERPTTAAEQAEIERRVAAGEVRRFEPNLSIALYSGCPLAEYLKRKGRTVGQAKSPQGPKPATLEVDGKWLPHRKVVELVNTLRRKDKLPPLPLPGEGRAKAAGGGT